MTFEHTFRAIHGYDPFPWQSAAARRLLEDKTLQAINVPTASGKTALIDAAIYAAAKGGPRRIAFIIDRRVVVDEAHERAKRIAEALTKPNLKEFAKQLGPIQVVRLRGGVHGDDDWVLYPERVTILVSTVDQIGSRLLHRGYGVSSRMSPMHAGFVGNDALYLIDEAHLSTPFVETVEAVQRYGAGVRLIVMTATPHSNHEGTVGLSPEDRLHPILFKRMHASKKARLVEIPGSEADFVKTATVEAEKFSKSSRVIGIIANRVSSARRIHKTLKSGKHKAELLTGRIRPYDRDRLLQRVLPEIKAGRVRNCGPPIFIVATQTVEVGADIDFDSLITEAAPLDSLRQRFGRLDRLGEIGKTEGCIIYRTPKSDSEELPSDPIYGMAIHQTWGWLKQAAEDHKIDFGIASLEDTMKMKGEPQRPEPKHAPSLLPAHIDLLTQTGPYAPEIDISAWLHGAGNGSSDVSLVWRADLVKDDTSKWAQTVRLTPPVTKEALEIPVYVARAWLEGRRPQDVTDIEGTEVRASFEERLKRPVLRWRGSDDNQIVTPREIVPGDTLILPSDYGGCDEYGWDPESTVAVEDVADFCALESGRNHTVRLVMGLTKWLGPEESIVHDAVREIVAAETELDPETGLDIDRITEAHAKLRTIISEIEHPLAKALKGQYEVENHPLGVVLRGRVLDDIDSALYGRVPVILDRHLEGVARQAEVLTCGHPYRESLVLAGKLHDLGKKEPLFQIFLHGNPVAAASGALLAKSGFRKLTEKIAAYRGSGLPKGFRHELGTLAFSETEDPLICYLIATHHGYGRPWFPVCSDSSASGVEIANLGNAWMKIFSALRKQFGPWVLAEMELLLRASDARQSIAEQETDYV